MWNWSAVVPEWNPAILYRVNEYRDSSVVVPEWNSILYRANTALFFSLLASNNLKKYSVSVHMFSEPGTSPFSELPGYDYMTTGVPWMFCM